MCVLDMHIVATQEHKNPNYKIHMLCLMSKGQRLYNYIPLNKKAH